ncbi:MAG: tetratricopeptide repeat protein [Chitinophagales bacterium]|nr:tetratricopeptide repeat protein [Chitinophagales bacterium]
MRPRDTHKPLVLTGIMVCLSYFLLLNAQGTTEANTAFRTAYAAYIQGSYSTAISHFNTAIAIDPYRHHFYYNRGLTYKAMGQTGAALADFEKSLSLRQTAEAYYQAGLMKYESTDFKGARKYFENAKELKEDLDKMNFCLGMIYYREELYEEALKCLYIYTYIEKNQPEAYYYRGMCEAKLKMYSEAIKSFKLALRYKENDWMCYYKMYEFYMELGDKQNALNSITMILEIGERKIEFYQKRAELYKELGLQFKYDEDMLEIKKLESLQGMVQGK